MAAPWSSTSGFLSWLRDTIGAPLTGLAGITTIRAFADVTFQEFLAALQQNDSRCPSDLRSRAFVDAFRTDWTAATARNAEHRTTPAAFEAQADALVYDLFELTDEQHALIDAEYRS